MNPLNLNPLDFPLHGSRLIEASAGTGKTFTLVSSIYRLLKSGYARRILFLVDRRALATQTVSALAAFTLFMVIALATVGL